MPIFVDARIPVVFAPEALAGPGDALLSEAGADNGDVPGWSPGLVHIAIPAGQPGHGAACACCAPRGAIAETLHRMFLARARGETAAFRRVVVSAGKDGRARVREALVRDPFLAGRYRVGDPHA